MSQERNGQQPQQQQSEIEEEKSEQEEEMEQQVGGGVLSGKGVEEMPVFMPPQSLNLFSSLPFVGDNSEFQQMFFPYNLHVGLIQQPPNILFNSLFNHFVSQQR